MRIIEIETERLLNIQISSLIFIRADVIILLFHELLNIFQVEVSKFIPIHRYINIELFYLW